MDRILARGVVADPNAWTTIVLAVPSNAVIPLAQLGVQFTTGSAWSGTVYVDAVTW